MIITWIAYRASTCYYITDIEDQTKKAPSLIPDCFPETALQKPFLFHMACRSLTRDGILSDRAETLQHDVPLHRGISYK